MPGDGDPKDNNPDWFALLTHARSLFIYHATQRLNSTRYFFAIFGVIFGAYLTVFANADLGATTKPLALFAIALFGFLVCRAYHMVDKRNEELVHTDENAMHFIEQQIIRGIESNQWSDVEDLPSETVAPPNLNSQLDLVGISNAMHQAPLSKEGATYSYVMMIVFSTTTLATIVAMGLNIFELIGAENLSAKK